MTKLQALKNEYHESQKYNHEFGGNNKKISEDYIEELEKVNKELTENLAKKRQEPYWPTGF